MLGFCGLALPFGGLYWSSKFIVVVLSLSGRRILTFGHKVII